MRVLRRLVCALTGHLYVDYWTHPWSGCMRCGHTRLFPDAFGEEKP